MKFTKKSCENFEGMRLDKFLSEVLDGISRAKVQKLIKNGDVLVNSNIMKPSYALLSSDEVFVKDFNESDESNEEIVLENIDIPIVFENDDFLVLDKPAGMVVHPGYNSHKNGTVVNAVINKVEKGVGDSLRPGIVHRLDKDTSGLMIVAKTKAAYDHFISEFKERRIKKVYLTLTYAAFAHKKGVIDSPISRSVSDRKKMGLASEGHGKAAVSKYKVVKEFEIDPKTTLSLLEVEIQTGRTHQIRVHMAGIDHPVIGDKAYGITSLNKKFTESYGLKRQFLHAKELEFISPSDGKLVKFTSDLPDDLQNLIERIS